MRTIAHLSDLHFGRVDPAVCRALRAALAEAAPDVVVVSGDLTQRARTSEFLTAKAFLADLAAPTLVVPGNHDVPLWNPYLRFFRPLARYCRLITDDLEPFYADAHVAIVGVNTARSLTVKDGRISREQIEAAREKLDAVPHGLIRVVVTHHPFEGRTNGDDSDVVGRAALAMRVFAGCRVDLVLSGHLHLSRVDPSAARYRIAGYSALLVQAGTAMSVRTRREANAFNLIRIEGHRIALECWSWQPQSDRFVAAEPAYFRRGDDGWVPSDGAALPEVVQVGDAVIAASDLPPADVATRTGPA